MALLFSTISFMVLLKVQPKDEDQARTMLATIVDTKQFVTRKFSNSLSFIEVSKGDKLFNGDQIFTGDNSTAKVIFQKSGNILNIPARGLVKIVEGSSGEENVDIQKGLAEFVIQKGQTMNITQGNETITLKSDDNEQGTGKLFFKDNKIVLQVDSGKINLNNSNGVIQEVNKNESVSMVNEVITKIAGVGLIRPSWGQKIDVWKNLILEWSNKGEVEAILYRDSELKEVVGRTFAVTSPYEWSLPLQEGRYYLMVKPKGSKEQEAVSIPLDMVSNNKINEFTPADNSVVNLKRGDALKLSWNKVPAARYKVTINNHDNENSTFMTDIAEYEVQEIKGSSLSWSVAPQLASGVLLSDSVTNHVNLVFGVENTITSPKQDQKFLLGKDKVELIWTTLKNERSSIKLINAVDNQVIFERETTDNNMIFKPETPGVYLLMVTSKDFPSPTQAEVKFTVLSKIAEWEIKAPIELSSIDLEEKKIELKFVPINKDLTEYELSVYSDEALINKILTSKVATSKIIYTVKKFGTFCFILKPINDVSSWLPSAGPCIIYTEKPPFDIIAATKNIVLKYKKVNGVGSYLISLPEVQRAAFYEIQVFNKSQNVIFSDRSKSNVIVWPSSKSGIFSYKYRVVDSKGRASDYSGVSKLIFPISPLTDWKE